MYLQQKQQCARRRTQRQQTEFFSFSFTSRLDGFYTVSKGKHGKFRNRCQQAPAGDPSLENQRSVIQRGWRMRDRFAVRESQERGNRIELLKTQECKRKIK